MHVAGLLLCGQSATDGEFVMVARRYGDRLDDAQLVAEAGRFPRAHALATLSCEEMGKVINVCMLCGACLPLNGFGIALATIR